MAEARHARMCKRPTEEYATLLQHQIARLRVSAASTKIEMIREMATMGAYELEAELHELTLPLHE
jgi:hypothetical protein